MSILKKNPAMTCPTCHGDKRVAVTKWVMGKGKVTVGRKCHTCGGQGKLARR